VARLTVGTKHILFDTVDDIAILRQLTTVDDVGIVLAVPSELDSAEALRQELTRAADFDAALAVVSRVRPVDAPLGGAGQRGTLDGADQDSTLGGAEQRDTLDGAGQRGTFSVTVTAARSPLGSSAEIAAVVSEAVTARLGWQPREADRAPIDLRVFADGASTILAVRLFASPLSDRSYRRVHVRGALRPTVAAAMVRLACDDGRPHRLWDPFCGSGTILAEAALAGHEVYGTELDPAVASAATQNLSTVDPNLRERVSQGDSTSYATWRDHQDADTVVANLPWGKQVALNRGSALYDAVGLGVARLHQRGGRAVLLTIEPDRLAGAIRRIAPSLAVERRRIGLLGQTPTILSLG
jgi:23S rRNA G2445 N2-methylase RlmL